MYHHILGIPGSSSVDSINRQLVGYVIGSLSSKAATVLDLNDFSMPIYSAQHEQVHGIPSQAKAFIQRIASADLLVVSLAEHNGSYTSFFKNVIDWSSRASKEMFGKKPMLLLSTSPGGRGGLSVLEAAKAYFPFLGAAVKATLSIPFFHKVVENGKLNAEWQQKLEEQILLLR